MSDERIRRKLAAILALDVVGFSRLMHSDDLAAFNLVRRMSGAIFEPIVTELGGVIFKHTGDGVLARFESVHDAFEAAEKIIAEVVVQGEASLRIGIHLGDVIDSDGDVFGDSVNIACRLESLALQNGICISERAWIDLRQRKIPFRDLGIQQLKNIETPMRVFMHDPSTANEEVIATEDAAQLRERRTTSAPAVPRKPLVIAGIAAGVLGLGSVGAYFAMGPSEAAKREALDEILASMPCSWLTAATDAGDDSTAQMVVRGISNMDQGVLRARIGDGVESRIGTSIEIDTDGVIAIANNACNLVQTASQSAFPGESRVQARALSEVSNSETFAAIADKITWDGRVLVFEPDAYSPYAQAFGIDERGALRHIAPLSMIGEAREAEEGLDQLVSVIALDQSTTPFVLIADGSEASSEDQLQQDLQDWDTLLMGANAGRWNFELVQ